MSRISDVVNKIKQIYKTNKKQHRKPFTANRPSGCSLNFTLGSDCVVRFHLAMGTVPLNVNFATLLQTQLKKKKVNTKRHSVLCKALVGMLPLLYEESKQTMVHAPQHLTSGARSCTRRKQLLTLLCNTLLLAFLVSLDPQL